MYGMNMNMRRLLAAGVCGLAISTSAFAQEGAGAASAESEVSKDDGALGEIVVTARRRTEALSDVPVSVTAFSQEGLDRIGARDVDDITLLTPGVQFERDSFGASNRSSISIRGINSTVGANTVGVYLDDTPIQVRNIYFSSTNAYPRLFDLDRVEILRGPQGTLFGAGSQGGTVRFISPAPNLSETQIYGRGEIATTRHGSGSYEAGLAVGVPLVTDKVAIRASGWHRRDGGWIDRVDVYNPDSVLEKNANHSEATVGRIAMAFAPTENLTITP